MRTQSTLKPFLNALYGVLFVVLALSAVTPARAHASTVFEHNAVGLDFVFYDGSPMPLRLRADTVTPSPFNVSGTDTFSFYIKVIGGNGSYLTGVANIRDLTTGNVCDGDTHNFNPDGTYQLVTITCQSPSMTETFNQGDSFQIEYRVDSLVALHPDAKIFLAGDLYGPEYQYCTSFTCSTPALTVPTTTLSGIDYLGISQTVCSLTNLTGCFQNALAWAFVPPNGAFNGIIGIWGTIDTKPPFGYFTVGLNEVNGINSGSTPMFSLETIDGINTYIFHPIDVALAAIWWGIFGIWFFFNRVRHLDI